MANNLKEVSHHCLIIGPLRSKNEASLFAEAMCYKAHKQPVNGSLRSPLLR